MATDEPYVTCDEYCVRLSDALRMVFPKEDTDEEDFPWAIDELSDHLPISMELKTADFGFKARVVTWNVLNKKYIRHLQPTEKNDNQRLGNHAIANMDPAAQTSREWNVAQRIIAYFDLRESTILCLQEVSASLMEILGRQLGELYSLLVTRTNREKDSDVVTNCNMVIVHKNKYTMNSRIPVIPGEIDEKTNIQCRSECDVFQLIHTDSGTVFNVISVHLPWSTDDYPKMFLDFKTEHKTIIAGDFNRGVRYPIAKDGMHMRVYSDLRFKFPALKICNTNKGEIFSHVCHLQNVGSHDRMIERFDHIIIMAPI